MVGHEELPSDQPSFLPATNPPIHFHTDYDRLTAKWRRVHVELFYTYIKLQGTVLA